MHVALDLDTCQQTGYCVRVLPEVFGVLDGKVALLEADPDPEFDDRLDEAERLCPTGAIVIET